MGCSTRIVTDPESSSTSGTSSGSGSGSGAGSGAGGSGTPSLAWSPLTHGFGNVDVGSNSTTQVFTLTNSGTASATGCSAPTIADTTNFAITADTCATSNLAGSNATCTVTVRSNPTTTGAKATTLSRTCTVGGTVSTTSNQITATGVTPALAWSPLTYDFGNNVYAYGKSSSITFTLSNTGTSSATGCSAPTLSGANPTEFEISIDNCGTSNLATSSSCTVNVRTKLTGTGVKTATLSRTCTIGGTTTTTANQIQATGIATTPNLVMRSETNGSFGVATLNKYTTTQDIIIGNTGTASATGCGAPALADTTYFSLVSHDCGASIASGAHCTARVRARVTVATASHSTSLSISCTGVSANQTVTVGALYSHTPSKLFVGYPTMYLMSDGRSRYSALSKLVPTTDNLTAITDGTMVASSNSSQCTLRTGGTIQCFGWNASGQLGDGTTTDVWSIPVTVSGITDAVWVSGNRNGEHYCAVLSAGAVKCWGKNSNGQLGNGTTTNSSVPVSVSGITNATKVAAGETHSCAVLSNGNARCWGDNTYGMLGDGTTTQSLTPVTVQTSSGVSLVSADSVSASAYATCILHNGGTAKCFGLNNYGVIGDGTTTNRSFATAVSGLNTASKIGISYASSCALLNDGTVQCWGSNGRGELGDGTTTDSLTPVSVSGLSGVTDISSGWLTHCAIKSNGEINCWGENRYDGSSGGGGTGNLKIASEKTAITNATQLASGSGSTCALISDGTVKCWGDQVSNRQTGHNNSGMNVSVPATLSGITTATQVASADATNCVLLGSGSIKCIGRNVYGQIGDGTTATRATPTSVLNISTATQIAGGGQSLCARLSDGTAKCWGYNSKGQLGDGTTTNTSTPVTVSGLSDVSAIYVGRGEHACAVLSSGDVKCWGYNNRGQLGDGTTTNRSAPTLVPNLHNVSSLSLGTSHSCAVLTDGTAKCWGYNNYGQLGDGTTTQSTSPINVSWYSNIASLSTGPSHTCAVLTDGKVRCWGYGIYGELGSGNVASNSNVSTSAVFSLTGISQMSSGGKFNCAVDSGGIVKCWGNHDVGMPVTGLRSVSGFIP